MTDRDDLTIRARSYDGIMTVSEGGWDTGTTSDPLIHGTYEQPKRRRWWQFWKRVRP